MTSLDRKFMIEMIRKNISEHGHHTYLVTEAPLPRIAYTIGLSPVIGFELILAGATYYMADEVNLIINEISGQLKKNLVWEQLNFEVSSLGCFTINKVDTLWSKELMLGAFDFYNTENIPALQIVPEQSHWTIDVPDLAQAMNTIKETPWKWLHKPWNHSVPEKSTAVTNIAALRGDRITEVMFWEEGHWELFAGAAPDVPREDIRVIPLGTLLAIDQSLDMVTKLKVGQGLWRDLVELKWHPWGGGEV